MDNRAGLALATELLDSLLRKTDRTIDRGMNGPILAHMRIGTGPVPEAFLTDENFPRGNDLPAEALNATPLCDAISTVTGGTTCFLMSHSGRILRIFHFRARKNQVE